ncbi:MAG: RHS repeat-associated core domain-containing protein [Nanoarchaeota archaeon]
MKKSVIFVVILLLFIPIVYSAVIHPISKIEVEDIIPSIQERDSSIGSKIYYYGTGLVAKEESDEISYYHKDRLGSTTVVTDESGAIVESNTYLPYGENLGNSDETFGFAGKERDVSGLTYFNARYYDPSLGVFTSVDPGRDGMNWYQYTASNPIKFVDPTGTVRISFFNKFPMEVTGNEVFFKSQVNRANALSSEGNSLNEVATVIASGIKNSIKFRHSDNWEPYALQIERGSFSDLPEDIAKMESRRDSIRTDFKNKVVSSINAFTWGTPLRESPGLETLIESGMTQYEKAVITAQILRQSSASEGYSIYIGESTLDYDTFEITTELIIPKNSGGIRKWVSSREYKGRVTGFGREYMVVLISPEGERTIISEGIAKSFSQYASERETGHDSRSGGYYGSGWGGEGDVYYNNEYRSITKISLSDPVEGI